jgi:hypothetical protein
LGATKFPGPGAFPPDVFLVDLHEEGWTCHAEEAI